MGWVILTERVVLDDCVHLGGVGVDGINLASARCLKTAIRSYEKDEVLATLKSASP